MGGCTVDLRSLIRDVPDFPKKGIVFKDITPLLQNGEALSEALDRLASHFKGRGVTKVIGIESRGYIFAPAIALKLGAGFVPVRKPGKLPFEVEREDYQLEYGTDQLEVHRDAFNPGDRVLMVDDVIATGGTAAASIRLVRRLGAEVAGLGALVELDVLDGRSQLPDDVDLYTLVHY